MKSDMPPMWSVDAIKQAQRDSFKLSPDVSRRVASFEATANKMLDNFARYMLWAGYRPDECRVIERTSLNGQRSRLIEVCGVECFEVTMAMETSEDYVVTMTATPRVIEWPPRRGMPSDEMMDILTGSKS
jgi:hypothetical protein